MNWIEEYILNPPPKWVRFGDLIGCRHPSFEYEHEAMFTNRENHYFRTCNKCGFKIEITYREYFNYIMG